MTLETFTIFLTAVPLGYMARKLISGKKFTDFDLIICGLIAGVCLMMLLFL